MAERLDHKNFYMLTLTYSERTLEDRQGAVSFRYSDVSAFLKRLASRAKDLDNISAPRFVVTGEKGTKRGRVHWHMILFADADVTRYGQWMKYGQTWHGPRKGKRNRLDWSLWPHGYVEIQEANANRCAYVLKYAFKDQFQEKRAKGTKRENKAEAQATGMFRMSKGRGRGQAIGEPWLQRQLQAILDRGSWPVKLEFPVPAYGGYWRPVGAQRRNLLDILKREALERKTRPLQWGAFLADLSDKERQEFDGTQDEQEEYEAEQSARRRKDEAQQRQIARDVQSIRRSCGGKAPCKTCVNALSERAFARCVDVSRNRQDAPSGQIAASDVTCHPFCAQRATNGWAFEPWAGRETRGG